METTTLIGVAGSFSILLAFTMNQLHRWRDDDILYDGVNFIGASLLLIYALLLKSYPFVVLNLVWGVVSFRDLVFDVRRDFFNGKFWPRRKHPFHKRKSVVKEKDTTP